MSPQDASFAEGLDGTVREEGSPPAERVLHVVWQGGGRTLALRDGQRVVLGRDAECDVVIPSPAVSRRHAAILGGAVSTIEDLGSVNGTMVGARVLAPGGRAPMGGGIVARIGPAIVLIDEVLEAGGASSSRGEWVVGASSPTPALAQMIPIPAGPRLKTISPNRLNKICAAPPPVAHPTATMAIAKNSGVARM